MLENLDLILTIIFTTIGIVTFFYKTQKSMVKTIVDSNIEVLKAVVIKQSLHDKHERRIDEAFEQIKDLRSDSERGIESVRHEAEKTSEKLSGELRVIHKRLDDIYKLVAGK